MRLLKTGEIHVIGRHPAASNAVFMVRVDGVKAIYKPVAGERALWDFPEGVLARREVAAHDFVSALGFTLVPPTVWREDGPYGPGSLQLWIEDASVDDIMVASTAPPGWLRVLDAQLENGTPVLVSHRDSVELRTVAILDAIMNNADRKAGHLLRGADRSLHLVDHGVAFHADPKLRTVLWGFIDELIPPALLDLLARVPQATGALEPWLASPEIEATAARADELLRGGVFPRASGGWPAFPWPVF